MNTASALERIRAELSQDLSDVDSATMQRACRAAEQLLDDSGNGDASPIAAAVRAGVAASRCP